MNSKERKDDLKFLRKVSSICSVVFKIFSVLCFIAAIVCLIFMIVSPFIPWDETIKFVKDNIQVDAKVIDYLNIRYAEVGCVIGLISFVASMFGTDLSYHLFRNIKKEGTPFRSTNVSLLNKIGVVSLIQGVGIPCISTIITLSTKTSDLFTGTISGVSIIFGLLIFALSLVFKYGVSLQDEADTTL